ncbi:hypothetical protein JCM11641_004853 [Rhodosporidiobolus odoratus]
MSSLGIGRPSTGKANSRHPRQSSGAYLATFDPAQIQTFREAFSLIDQDNDGVISESDLTGLLASLGQTPSPQLLQSLLTSRPSSLSSSPSSPSALEGHLNFTTFVTLMSEHLQPLDTEPELLEAFASFDDSNSGFVKASELREGLKSLGDRMGDEEIDRLLHPPFYDPRTGLFDYRKFCAHLRVVDVEEEEAIPGATMAAAAVGA